MKWAFVVIYLIQLLGFTMLIFRLCQEVRIYNNYVKRCSLPVQAWCSRIKTETRVDANGEKYAVYSPVWCGYVNEDLITFDADRYSTKTYELIEKRVLMVNPNKLEEYVDETYKPDIKGTKITLAILFCIEIFIGVVMHTL